MTAHTISKAGGTFMDMGSFGQQFIQQIINGVSLGSIYALIALGYTLNDATKALEHVDPILSTSERVREALKG